MRDGISDRYEIIQNRDYITGKTTYILWNLHEVNEQWNMNLYFSYKWSSQHIQKEEGR